MKLKKIDYAIKKKKGFQEICITIKIVNTLFFKNNMICNDFRV